MEQDKLERISESMPYFLELLDTECFLGVYDLEKCVGSHNKNFDVGLKVGSEMNPNSVAAEAIEKRDRAVREVSKEVFGVPYIGRGVPVFQDGEVIGAVSIGLSTEAKEKMVEMAHRLSSSLEEMTASIEETSSNTEQVAELSRDLDEHSKRNLEDANQTDDILKLIHNVSKQTKMLGLNASIEAVRAGAQGKGFQVVADEVGKLAENSSNSTEQVSEILERIKEGSNEVSSNSANISDILQQLAAANQQIAATTQSLSALSDELLEIAKKMNS